MNRHDALLLAFQQLMEKRVKIAFTGEHAQVLKHLIEEYREARARGNQPGGDWASG